MSSDFESASSELDKKDTAYNTAIRCGVAVLAFSIAVLFIIYCNEMLRSTLSAFIDFIAGPLVLFLIWLIGIINSIIQTAAWSFVVKLIDLYSLIAIPLTLLFLSGYLWCACFLNTMVKKGETASAYIKVGVVIKRLNTLLLCICFFDFAAALNSIERNSLVSFSGCALFFVFVGLMASISTYTEKNNPLIFKKDVSNEL